MACPITPCPSPVRTDPVGSGDALGRLGLWLALIALGLLAFLGLAGATVVTVALWAAPLVP
jgi:hypothetical protein